jgi:hypothetical protein
VLRRIARGEQQENSKRNVEAEQHRLGIGLARLPERLGEQESPWR